MALSRQTLQTLVNFVEMYLSQDDKKASSLHLCHQDLLREWSRQENELFKTRAYTFSRRYKQSRSFERARAHVG